LGFVGFDLVELQEGELMAGSGIEGAGSGRASSNARGQVFKKRPRGVKITKEELKMAKGKEAAMLAQAKPRRQWQLHRYKRLKSWQIIICSCL